MVAASRYEHVVLQETRTLQEEVLSCRVVKKSKHIDMRYHFMSESIRNYEIRMVLCRSEDELANIFTKPLGK